MSMLSADAVKNDEALGLPLVQVKELYLDHDFNCRGWFSPTECIELAKDIARNGLQQPIIIRRLRKHQIGDLKPETELINKGYRYKVIGGHRRVTAYKINEHPVIPAIIREDNLTAFQEKDINAVENIHRKELNFQQEAHAIKHYWMAGWNRQDIADRIGKSPGWVQLRVILLTLPQEIQDLAGQGYVIPNDMLELNKLKDRDKVLKAAAILRDKRKSGTNTSTLDMLKEVKQKEKSTTKKIRSKSEIRDMMDLIRSVFCNVDRDQQITLGDIYTPSGNFLGTRLLAWASGEIDNYAVHKDIQEAAEKFGLEYELPEFAPG